MRNLLSKTSRVREVLDIFAREKVSFSLGSVELDMDKIYLQESRCHLSREKGRIVTRSFRSG